MVQRSVPNPFIRLMGNWAQRRKQLGSRGRGVPGEKASGRPIVLNLGEPADSKGVTA